MKLTFQKIGDFYEAFDEDARAVSGALGLTLTKTREGRPLCGIAYHAFPKMRAELEAAGHEVEVAQ